MSDEFSDCDWDVSDRCEACLWRSDELDGDDGELDTKDSTECEEFADLERFDNNSSGDTCEEASNSKKHNKKRKKKSSFLDTNITKSIVWIHIERKG